MSADFVQIYAGFFITPFGPASLYNVAAWTMLLAAAAATVIAGARPSLRSCGLILPAIAAAICGIFLIQYLTWTPVGTPTVLGVVGRYFLPLAAILPFMLAGPRRPYPGVPIWLAAPIMAFPISSILLSVHYPLFRFYL